MLYNWVTKVRKPEQTGFKSLAQKRAKEGKVAKQSQQLEATAKASRRQKKCFIVHHHFYLGTILTHPSMVALPPSLLYYGRILRASSTAAL
jgi:hypothetical protein